MKVFLLLLLFLPNLFYNPFAGDTITPNSFIKDGQTLVSAGGSFELGFFSPGNSKMRYLGIWFKKIPVQTVVWVANRDTPVSDSLGSLKIGETGNLILFDGSQKAVWSLTASSNLSNPIAQLLDNGNFVLRNKHNVSESYIWESFYSPSDTLLPGMKLGWNLKAGLESKLTTWKSSDDPSNGDYTFNLDISGSPEMFIRHGSQPVYRNGPWTGYQFSGEPEMASNSYLSFDFISNQDEIYYTYKVNDNSVTFRLVLNQSLLQRYIWHDSMSSWSLYWSIPRDQCDFYAECGPYGVCNSNYSPVCSCVRGFKPKNTLHWNLRDGSDGCVRVTELDCKNGDGFLKMSGIKLPDTTTAVVIHSISLEECRISCLKNCSCLAYASANISVGGSGCITWGNELIDLRQFVDGGQDFYIRLAASELRGSSKKKHVIIIVVAFSMLMLLLGSVGYCLWKKKKLNLTGFWRNKLRQLSFDTVITEHLSDDEGSRRNNTDLPLFDFETILIATQNFSNSNKLGEGGFGIVYKGKLEDGHEIAVKRLSKSSSQGLVEFKNEVILIAKLQHNNLVRLLGCCIEGEEKMLIYEYMENRSLDTILFDKTKSSLLSWSMRFKIIVGIARGLIYLHQDSRLRIIHRDLKASNILLDQEMNPKISDFGLARIFGGEETNTYTYTKRVVGTYGYMSPEYAMDGIFSTKSDVFSFGVLVLEIISGKKNKGIHISDERINLLAHAWNLWKEGKSLELLDSSLGGSCLEPEVLRCMHLGLLCVQERADDRPSMSMVLLMLSSENVVLPNPKNPGFCEGESSSDTKLSWSFCANDMSVTKLEGR